ncbi:MAG: BON domain-containing protein [Ramlibacter sp.]|nr:BON domain-containing protein [Ramlibacter sp.]
MKEALRKATAGALLLAAPGCFGPALAQERRNWFEDPFFRVSQGMPDCPVPLGPLLTREEQRAQAHYRIERGTSCWLAGKCRDSNAYRYDKELAPQVEAALRAVPGMERSSLWVTIQRRWVFLEGCAETAAQIGRFEQAARQVPEVEAVVPALSVGDAAPRYPLRDEPARGR